MHMCSVSLNQHRYFTNIGLCVEFNRSVNISTLCLYLCFTFTPGTVICICEGNTLMELYILIIQFYNIPLRLVYTFCL